MQSRYEGDCEGGGECLTVGRRRLRLLYGFLAWRLPTPRQTKAASACFVLARPPTIVGGPRANMTHEFVFGPATLRQSKWPAALCPDPTSICDRTCPIVVLPVDTSRQWSSLCLTSRLTTVDSGSLTFSRATRRQSVMEVAHNNVGLSRVYIALEEEDKHWHA